MVRVISTGGLPEGMLDGLEGWANSEFSESTADLLESLEVPVPDLERLERVLPSSEVLHEPKAPVVVKRGRKRKEATKDPALVRQMIIEAKRRAKG